MTAQDAMNLIGQEVAVHVDGAFLNAQLLSINDHDEARVRFDDGRVGTHDLADVAELADTPLENSHDDATAFLVSNAVDVIDAELDALCSYNAGDFDDADFEF